MKKKLQTGFSPVVILLIVAVIAAAGIAFYMLNKKAEPENTQITNTDTTQDQDNQTEDMTSEESSIPVEGKMVSVVLEAQNKSGQSGSATITNINGKAKVVISVKSGPKDAQQPAHIHLKSCSDIGGIKYSLTSVVNGKSETTVDTSVEALLKALPLAINVHKSAAESSVYVACGDIQSEASLEDDMIDTTDKVDDTTKKIGEEMMGTGEQVLTPPAPVVKTFNITGQNFAFSSSEIKVKKGDTVKINFESTGGFHDWFVDGYNKGTTQVNTDGKTSVEFVADKAGTFEFFCTVGNHRAMGMTGSLIVE